MISIICMPRLARLKRYHDVQFSDTLSSSWDNISAITRRMLTFKWVNVCGLFKQTSAYRQIDKFEKVFLISELYLLIILLIFYLFSLMKYSNFFISYILYINSLKRNTNCKITICSSVSLILLGLLLWTYIIFL